VSNDDRITETEHATTYEIRVKGVLAQRWSVWFDGMTIEPVSDDGTTAIRGPVADQAALHGLLHRLRDVGIPLVSLTEIPRTSNNEPTRASKEI
jgi:hypothetical protein